MSFLNWVLLGGIAAFAAPLIIHLLFRTRFKVVEWGAMQLLDAALQVNSQRWQWQSLLLLLIRCLIPILLAFSLARPVFTSWRATGGSGDKSLVVLIDNSISMQAGQPNGLTRFAQTIQQARTVIEQQAPSTELSVWTIGGQPIDRLNGTTFDHRHVLNQLENLRSGAGSVAVQSALSAGLKQISSMQNASREIILISDFQNHEWPAFGEVERAAFKRQLLAEAIPVHLTLLPIRDTVATTNLSVTLDPLEQPLIVMKQVFRISAQVENHGSKPSEGVSAVLQVAGTEVARRRLSVPAGGVTQAVFDCQIESPGTHAVSVRIDDTAGPAGDNVAHQIINVRSPLEVLIVDRQANAPELQRASGYLSLALSPFQADETGKNLMLTRVVSPDRIARNETADYNVVVLADAPRLNDSIASELVEFVRQGGGLLLFSGNAFDMNWYNSRWGPSGKTPILPGTYSAQPKLPLPAQVSSDAATHAAFNVFDQSGGEDYASVEIHKWLTLSFDASNAIPADGSIADTSTSAVQVLLKLQTGDPLLITQAFGNGNVAQMATAADTSGSNLPLRPIFVPLMQSLVQWLATGVEPIRNIACGQPFTITFPKSAQVARQADAAKQAIVSMPDQSKVKLPLDDHQPQSFTETSFPGVYTVAFGQDLNSEQNNVDQRFAVSAPRDESRMQFMTADELNEFADATGASLALDAQELLMMQSVRTNGREVWRWFMLALVALLFIELWWQQRITRGHYE